MRGGTSALTQNPNNKKFQHCKLICIHPAVWIQLDSEWKLGFSWVKMYIWSGPLLIIPKTRKQVPSCRQLTRDNRKRIRMGIRESAPHTYKFLCVISVMIIETCLWRGVRAQHQSRIPVGGWKRRSSAIELPCHHEPFGSVSISAFRWFFQINRTPIVQYWDVINGIAPIRALLTIFRTAQLKRGTTVPVSPKKK